MKHFFHKIFFIILLLQINSLLLAGEIITSPQDHREYKHITLENQLEVILVSDPNVEKASAALSIQVGSYNDPEEIPGMAHFLEHMLFLGTKKYPDASYYSNYISQHGGSSNAFTKATDTVYFYDIDHRYLKQSLDNFSRFFIDPLFSKKFTNRELNAINAEHSKNIQSDPRRSYHVMKELAKSSHPFSKFSTGNKDTLIIHKNLNEKLVEFYDQNYSSNIMTLAVIGRESLDVLETYVKNYFSEIKNKKVTPKKYDWQKYDDNLIPSIVQIKPLELKRTLSLTFYGKGNIKNYRYKATSYIGNLLGDESNNSLFNFLKKKNLVNSLGAHAFDYDDNDAGGLNVRMDLTEKGEKQVDSIIGYFFEYLELFKRKGIEEWRHQELNKISDDTFQYAYQPLDPSDLVIKLASNSRYIPVEDLIYADYRFDQFNPELIKHYLSFVTPENMLAVQVSPNAQVNKKEKWYQAEYGVKKIDSKQIKKWEKQSRLQKTGFKLPVENNYINEVISIHKKKDKDRLPKQIFNEPGLSFYFLQDDKFNQSDSVLSVEIALPDFLKSVENTALTKLYIDTLFDKLNADLYQATIAQYRFSVSPNLEGLTIKVSGYFDQFPKILKKILSGLDISDYPDERISVLKQNIIKNYENERLKPANQIGFTEYRYLNSKFQWYFEQYLDVIPEITTQQLKEYQKTLFNKSYVNVFLFGNVLQEDANQIYDILKKDLKYSPIDKDTLPTYQNLILKNGIDIVRMTESEDKDSSVIMFFQNPQKTVKNAIINELLQLSFSDAAYYQLRTVEQLGYLVGAFPVSYNYTPQTGIMVQSPEKTPDFIEKRIREFLMQFGEDLKSMPNETLDSQKSVLKNKYLENPKTFDEAFSKFYSALSNKDYNMERDTLMVKILDTITKDDLMKYYNDTFLSHDNREFILQVYGKDLKIPVEKKEGNREFILNKEKFKQSSEFYPHLYYTDIAASM